MRNLVLGLGCLAVVLSAFPGSVPAVDSPAAVEVQVIDVGNKVCPVGGDKVSGKDFVEHEGKRYGLCCSMCMKDFLKDPAKFIAKMEQQEAETGHEIEEGMGHQHG